MQHNLDLKSPNKLDRLMRMSQYVWLICCIYIYSCICQQSHSLQLSLSKHIQSLGSVVFIYPCTLLRCHHFHPYWHWLCPLRMVWRTLRNNLKGHWWLMKLLLKSYSFSCCSLISINNTGESNNILSLSSIFSPSDTPVKNHTRISHCLRKNQWIKYKWKLYFSYE